MPYPTPYHQLKNRLLLNSSVLKIKYFSVVFPPTYRLTSKDYSDIEEIEFGFFDKIKDVR